MGSHEEHGDALASRQATPPDSGLTMPDPGRTGSRTSYNLVGQAGRIPSPVLAHQMVKAGIFSPAVQLAQGIPGADWQPYPLGFVAG